MTARRLPLIALLAALAAPGALSGCSKTSARPSLRLSGPSAVAVYHGRSERDPSALRHYLAVANERGDDLRILDALDGRAVLAPGLILSLSVPTAPRPALLAAGSLADGEADLLVVAPAGLATCDPQAPTRLVSCLQVVDTWTAATALAPPLTVVVGQEAGDDDAAVLSLAVVPVPEAVGPGLWRAAPGQARVVAGLTGGRLLVVDFRRVAGGSAIERVGAAVHDLGFDAVSLSGSPDLDRLFAASPDPIGLVEGVAELDLTGPFSLAPAVRAIAAGAPTTHVLAARVRPLVGVQDVVPDVDRFGDEELRVWAALDPARCGRERPLTCGLAVLDPDTGGPVPDPKDPTQPHLPIFVPGTTLALTAVYPPAVGSVNLDGSAAPDDQVGPLQRQITTFGERYVSTLAAVASSTGVVTLVDLARGTVAIDRDVLAVANNGGAARLGAVASAAHPAPTDPAEPAPARLGLWDLESDTAQLSTESSTLSSRVEMTPGYTLTDTWVVLWEGVLPGLNNLRGQFQSSAGGAGQAWVAVQSSSGAGPKDGPYRGVGRLYHPRLGIHVGDVVAVTPDDAASKAACPRGVFELQVDAFLAPGPDFPGGALAVSPRPLDQQPTVSEGGVVVPANPQCLDAADRSTVRVTIRSGGLLLTATNFGYGGRVEPQAAATGPAKALSSADLAALSCPLLDDETWPPAAACDDGCRTSCEALLLARKARRQFYLIEQCLPVVDSTCATRWGTSTLDNVVGPTLRFKAGWTDEAAPKVRGTQLTISTVGGLFASDRRPLSGGQPTAAVQPAGLATFDRAGATFTAADGVRVFGAYTGNLVLDFSPAQSPASVTVHR